MARNNPRESYDKLVPSYAKEMEGGYSEGHKPGPRDIEGKDWCWGRKAFQPNTWSTVWWPMGWIHPRMG